MRLNRSTLALACGLLAAGSCVSAAPAPEYEVKAAFLLNFPSFVEWPPNTFNNSTQPLVLGIFGRDPFQGSLTRMAAAKTVNGRSLLIRVLTDPNQIRACQVVFFPAANGYDPQIAAALEDLGILTVGEVDGFAEHGGIINFVIENRHVRFEVNQAAAERAHLKMSSKLLQLAIIVRKTLSEKPPVVPAASRTRR